ncbi:Flp family type IVb pilin [Hansschlegelia zhihuaiae]|uniref:Flp family type IVb pilin n=2 Tax=Hansschlegelia zhihuaiae TaxID=405005 RepID=A0A4Q0MCQ2_9HYPH|nr:Flp family type IVb pilin [Hansschlegelia zhihuaiae]RXF70873.1 Flp family type IVb pilin [Hansschlegelia zhihuaiae]
MRRALGDFGRDRRGATAIEYALIAVGISIAAAMTVYAIGSSLKTNFYDKVEEATRN